MRYNSIVDYFSIFIRPMPRILIFLFLVSLFHVPVISVGYAMPVDTFRHIPRKQLIQAAGDYYNHELHQLDSANIFHILDQMAVISRERKAPELETYTLLLKGRYCYDQFYWKDSLPLHYFNAVLAAEACPEPVATEALFFKGVWHYDPGDNYPLAFEYMLKAHNDARKTGYRELPSAGFLLFRLAIGHLHFREPRIAIRHLKEAVRLPGNSAVSMVNLYNTTGMAYVSIQQYDSAVFYYRKALDHAVVWDTSWIGVISGNIGNVYFHQQKYDTAARLLYRDLTLSLQAEKYESATNAAALLGKIYLIQENMPATEQMLETCRQLLPHSHTSRWRAEYYECLSAYYKYNKNYERALQYTDSFILYTKYYSTERQREILEQARNKTETEAHLANIRLLESEKSRQIFVRNTIIIIFILTFIVIIQALRKINFRRKKEREIFEIEKRRKEEELHNAKYLLNSYIESLKQKQQLVDRFSHEIEQLQQMTGTSPAIAEKEEVLKRLQTATILTEEDWLNFKKLFTRVHSDFFIRLNEKFPNLTQAEIRLLALSKLGLSVNEKANMLGISPDSVRRAKQRLVKKTGLQEYEITKEE